MIGSRLRAALGLALLLSITACMVQDPSLGRPTTIHSSLDDQARFERELHQQKANDALLDMNRINDRRMSTRSETMVFKGRMNGGIGEVSLTDRGNGRYWGKVSAAVRGGGGEVEGEFARRGNAIVMVRPNDAAPCDLSLFLQANSIRLREGSCSYYHGAAVEFTGVLPQVN